MTKQTPKAEIPDKRQQILCAAQRCFARYGFAKTTLDDIAAGVGMKKASLYYYYENKESIFRDVIEYESSQLLKLLNERMVSCSSPEEKLRVFARTRIEYLQQTINLHDLSIQVILEVKPIIDRLFHSFQKTQVDYLSKILEEGIQEGTFGPCEVSNTATAILTVLEAVVLKEFQGTQVYSANDIDYEKLQSEMETILGLMIDGLKKS